MLGTAVHCQNITAFFPKHYPSPFFPVPASLGPGGVVVSQLLHCVEDESGVGVLLLHHASLEGTACAVDVLSES